MPGTLRRALAFTASTGRPPRWVTKSSCRCSRRPPDRTSCSSFSLTRWRPVRSWTRSLRSCGEALSRRSEPSSSIARWIDSASGVPARPPQRFPNQPSSSIARGSTRRARERRLDRAGELPQERRGLLGVVEGGPRAERPADRVGHVPQRPGCEHAAEGRVRRGLTDVVQAFERRLVRGVEQCDRLGRQRLAASDLAGIGGGHERARELRAVGARGRVREPLRDRRKLECHERVGIHATSVGRLRVARRIR